MLSVVIPSYNEEAMVKKTADVLESILNENQIPHELLFIDDGSCDGTWSIIYELSKNYNSVHGVHFSRNFGKEAAIMAGLEASKGDCAVVIDCDLQHPPEKIVEMYKLWNDGYEVVEAVKKSRGKESPVHTLCANAFYKIISSSTNIDMQRASDFKLLDKKAILALLNMQEKDAFFRALSSWIGFKTTQIEFEVQERTAGESKWSAKSLIKYALTNITSFSSLPMQFVTVIGTISVVISLILAVVCIVKMCNNAIFSYFTPLIAIILFLLGFIMIGMGIIGYYIGKIYDSVKNRPRYIISEKC